MMYCFYYNKELIVLFYPFNIKVKILQKKKYYLNFGLEIKETNTIKLKWDK